MILGVYFSEENSTGLWLVPFHPHSPFHTLKVTDIPSKTNRCNAKKMIRCDFV